jgi:hypothetical protein
MTRGRLGKRERQDDQLRQKRAQAAQAWPTAKRSRPSVGRAEPLPPHSYPIKRVALGKRQVPGVE